MVDKIIVTPEQIRGLGNIIIPKTLSDYIECNISSLIGKETTINAIQSEVFELKYYINPVILINAPTIFTPYIQGSKLTFPITVVDENNNPIHDIQVECLVDGDSTGHIITGRDGTAKFEWIIDEHYVEFDFIINESEHTSKSTNSISLSIGCAITLNRTGYVEE